MRKVAVSTEKAPAPIGPYSQAVLHDGKYTLNLSGQIGIDPKTGKLVSGIEAQTRQALENVGGILSAVGWGYENVTSVTVYLVDMKDYPTVNRLYERMFSDTKPARAVVGVSSLPLGALVEIQCEAAGDTVPRRLLETPVMNNA
ncbi:MAG: hypothetical protein HY362_02980 [Candidatus Aenigmarchaeota archaeon]|nr:hypothetical protein [Candidatus Aenigmarchaeota archaeon]